MSALARGLAGSSRSKEGRNHTMPLGPNSVSVAAVVVTYGNRLPLIQRVISYLETEPHVSDIVLVDNGCQPAIQRCDIVTTKSVRLISHAHNAGSAAGFRAGLVEARSLEMVDYIFLLDDDNVCIEGHGIAKLIELSQSLERSRTSGEYVVISALRVDRNEYLELLATPDKKQIIPNAFLGFHIRDLFRKLARSPARSAVPPTDSGAGATRKIVMAPYGGLFLPASLVATVDLPDPSFVLYSDDHEYTLRLSDAGASIYLSSDARIHDIEQSWNEMRDTSNPWINSKSDHWRIYYSSRNRAYLECRRFTTNFVFYAINVLTYLAYLTIASLRIDKSPRATAKIMWRLFRGVRDGWSGRLGYRSEYRLPYGRNEEVSPSSANS